LAAENLNVGLFFFNYFNFAVHTSRVNCDKDGWR